MKILLKLIFAVNNNNNNNNNDDDDDDVSSSLSQPTKPNNPKNHIIRADFNETSIKHGNLNLLAFAVQNKFYRLVIIIYIPCIYLILYYIYRKEKKYILYRYVHTFIIK